MKDTLTYIWTTVSNWHFWFGIVLPFIGWQTFECSWDGTIALDEVDEDGTITPAPEHLKTHTCSCFTLEWLSFGVGWAWTDPTPKKVNPTK